MQTGRVDVMDKKYYFIVFEDESEDNVKTVSNDVIDIDDILNCYFPQD